MTSFAQMSNEYILEENNIFLHLLEANTVRGETYGFRRQTEKSLNLLLAALCILATSKQ